MDNVCRWLIIENKRKKQKKKERGEKKKYGDYFVNLESYEIIS